MALVTVVFRLTMKCIMEVKIEKNRATNGQILTPNELHLTFQAPNYCTKFV